MSRIILLFCMLSQIAFSQKTIGATILKAMYNEKGNEVKLNWEKSDNTIREYILQHSTDEKNWKEIAQQVVTDFYSNQVYQFFHRSPVKGKNYYRLKMINTAAISVFSSAILVSAEATRNGWAIYPVPVGNVLTLEYKGNQKIAGIINIFITGINGYIHTRLRCSSLSRVIPVQVANLGRGIYEIKVIIQDEITWSQRFVK